MPAQPFHLYFALTLRLLLRMGLCLAASLSFSPVKAASLSLPFIENGIAFEIHFDDVPEEQDNTYLSDLLKEGIKIQRDENTTLKNYTDPNKIARFEQDIIRKILRSQGYYRFFVSAQIVYQHDKSQKPGSDSATLASKDSVEKIIYLITPGKRYSVKNVVYDLSDIEVNPDTKIALQAGSPLIAERILDAQTALQKHVLNRYCFYDVKIKYQVLLDHQTAEATVIFSKNPSPQAKFGPIYLEGLETVNESYLRSFITYRENECFHRDKVHNTRLALLRSNLIANAGIEIGPVEDGLVTTRFILSERHHRTLKAGIGFSTDENFYLTAGWEHRNIRGSGEKFQLNTRLSEFRQALAGEFFIPNFYAHNKSLSLYSEVLQEDLDAYQALALKSGMKIGFNRNEHLHYSAGTELKISKVEDETTREGFHLLSFPVNAQWDKTDSVLDPSEGFLVSSEIRPYVNLINTDTRFLKSILSVSAYHTFKNALQPTLAGRYSLGSILGESVMNIPADERFYVGGGGSVRGYPYQSLSILNGDDPEGGASFQQINTEMRIRVYDDWGFAVFAGGGFAFADATPDFNASLLWGAGVGVRYYTSFAPLRMDLAFPLNRRKDYDDNFQLYISIGQAF